MNTRHHYLSLLRTFALATLTAAAVTACTDDNGDPAGSEPITPADGIPVTFTGDIAPDSDPASADAPETRTVLTPDGNGGFTVTWRGWDIHSGNCDWICIWAANEDGLTSPAPKYYVPITSDVSSVLMPQDDRNKLTLPSTGEWKFTAVYGEFGYGSGTAPAPLHPQSQSAPNNTEHIARSDFSVATTRQHIEGGSEMPSIVSFKFEHKLSALQLQVKNETGAELTVREIRLSTAGQITTKKVYDVARGNWSANDDVTSDYLTLNITNPAALASNAADPQKFHMLLFPGYANTDMTITVITDRGEYTLTKTAPIGGFAAGKNYTTNITIKSSGLTDKETWTETISTAAQLAAFRDKVNDGNNYAGKTVRLTADIDLGNDSWTPIGNGALVKNFQGTFDGGGHHISGLNVDNGNANDAGLFGCIHKGTVRNLCVSGAVTTSGIQAGGIVGTLNNSSVENCIFSGNVSSNQHAGGIAGAIANDSRITGCHTNGTVTATDARSYAGGIVANNMGSVKDCYSSATVSTTGGFNGGITGSIMKNVGTVTRCYATGTVGGKEYIGGIAGNNDGKVEYCLALNPSLTRTTGFAARFGRITSYYNSSTVISCAAFKDMTLTDATTNQTILNRTGADGNDLTAGECLAAETYTFHGFTAANGWAFDTATPWAYLPWNKAFESFHNISETDYRISVPDHLNSGGTN